MAPFVLPAARAVTDVAGLVARPSPTARPIGRLAVGARAQERLQPAVLDARAAWAKGRPSVISREADTTTSADAAWSAIVDWLLDQGGYVDNRLQLTTGDAPCGSRGVVATSAVSVQDLEETPLIVVPQSAYMTTFDAQQLVERTCRTTATAAPLHWLTGSTNPSRQFLQLPAPARLALLLAHERCAKGPSSRWWPYIAALPKQPPNAWLMNPQELRERLEPMGSQAQQWRQATDRARQAMQQLAANCQRSFGKQLQLDDSDAILWSLGQVLSRAFGANDCMGLAPVIDLLNHRQGAAKPQAFTEEGVAEDSLAQQQAAAGSSPDGVPGAFWYVTSTAFGQPLPLAPGDELCISYVKGGSNRQAAALESFLNFGFVPLELQGK